MLHPVFASVLVAFEVVLAHGLADVVLFEERDVDAPRQH
jgi:hypothetical protein